ncbi:flagellar basal body-associated FliL family protein [Mesorhizobium sp. BAC0120]|uniref:flagellar basal body-associated FliL family protein n=1 Tax=Mesorhizobium sp. BAC0120 TaxID=3090670 RepID=UPI00298C6FEE|nr:flagellar basal body-associated FliL family protein [Mesorhizobium sp. BAC0120]MDW6024438.1 flagellar basal body-associated FliL family protein [Mesorhizobium sp. BAC0120]
MATVEQAPDKKAGPSIIIQVAILAIMTAAAIGIGWLSGSYLNSTTKRDQPAAAASEPAAKGNEKAKAGEEGDKTKGPKVVDLAPITTNLAAPSDTWVRLDLSIRLDAPTEDATLADTIQQDLLAFIRTVKLHQIEGASGFQHLKADLAERAAIRSNGLVTAVYIRTLIFE